MQRYLEAGKQAGFTEVEARRCRSRIREWEWKNDASVAREGEGNVLSVRVFRDLGTPAGFTLSAPSLTGVRKAFGEIMAGGMPDDRQGFGHLLPSRVDPVRLAIHDPLAFAPEEELRGGVASRLAELMIRHPGVTLTEWRLGVEERKVYLANTRGLAAKYRKTLFTLSLTLRRGDISLEVTDRRTHWKEIQPDRLLGRGVFVLGSLLGTPPGKSRKMPLLLTPHVSAAVLRDFAAVFRTAEGAPCPDLRFAPEVRISDRPLLNGMPGSIPFDDEGVSTGDTLLARAGSLQGRISDLESGVGTGTGSTGNGMRAPGELFPRVRFSNLCIHPSILPLSRIMQEAGTGVMLTLVRLRKAHGPERLYSAYGYVFNGTELGSPVHFTLDTSFLAYFLKIERVSRESGVSVDGGTSVISPYVLTEARSRGDEWQV